MARYLMFQGTGSGVGKSLMVAGFCRLFRRKGIRVVPFKAQNMSLNSGVTPFGEEIGRAQMLQARAALVDPDSRMNPVLLKPQGNCTSQVIVRGKVWETHQAYEYYQYKEFLWQKVVECLESLSNEFDLICIEGAGSPAEINLRDKDIVNMAIARYVKAPVCVIGDIEKGGVFAQLFGTWALLNEAERKTICGFLINKFRGDLNILKPGLLEIERLTGVPIVGVIPYSRFRLDDEDSMTETIESKRLDSKREDLYIGIVRIPHIANFTDYDPLGNEPDVKIQYFYPDENFQGYDLIILPGSKNTMSDLQWLKKVGFQEKLHEFIHRGGMVLGVCGGYQMLGENIIDLDGNEDHRGQVGGLSVIPTKTVFEREKIVRVMEGWVTEAKHIAVKGYEIHQGRSFLLKTFPSLFTLRIGNRIEPEGVMINNQIYGTYLHGLFDKGGFRRYFLNQLRKRKGLSPVLSASLSWQDIVENELDRLADFIETSVDMKYIEKIIENQ